MARGKKIVLSESFVNPFDVSIDVTTVEDNDQQNVCGFDDLSDNDGDPDYEPSFNITMQPHGINLEDFPSDNSELSDESDDEEYFQNVQEGGLGVSRVASEADVNQLLEEDFHLISLSQLLVLANTKLGSECSNLDCNGILTISTERVGSALYLLWVCPSGHVEHKWCSQPLLNQRLHSGDLLTSAAILMSGNNYGKIALFAKMLQLKIVSHSTFFKIQRQYLVPCVDEYWLSHQQEILDKYRDKELVILGDGRMDSPGFCAQYCSYTIMENDSKDILEIVTMDKRQTGKKSTIMEKAAFEQGLNNLLDKGLQIKEAVTDAHCQIGYLMKTVYPDITHSFDVWHAAKNLGKKIMKVGQQKNCKVIQKWSRHIVNHFWYCCQKASTYEEFLGRWCGVIHHVTNEHNWVLPYGQGTNSCDHGPLAESADSNKEWLEKGSPAHVALVKIIMDKRFTNQIHYLLNSRSTAELETFQQSILMYAAKRFSYIPPVYRARNRLAALDHNVHHSREIMRDGKGEVMYNRHFNKKSGRWSVFPVKVKKTYPHITPLKKLIIEKRLADKEGMQRKKALEPQDPRRISANLASLTPPPTASIVQEYISRRN